MLIGIGMFAAVIINIALLGGYQVHGLGSVAGAVELFGFMAAACYAATRNLWVPIGLHFGWNFAAGGIFSTVVSGNGRSEGLLEATMSGPAPLTGGAFGPEGSLYTVAAGVLLTVVFMRLARRRGHIVPGRRRRPSSGRAGRGGPGTATAVLAGTDTGAPATATVSLFQPPDHANAAGYRDGAVEKGPVSGD